MPNPTRPSLKANPDRCPECRSLKTRASVDSRLSVFRRCEMCDHQWSTPKPHDYASGSPLEARRPAVYSTERSE